VGPGLQAARFPWRGVNHNHRSGRVFRDRRAVHRGLGDALRRALRARCPSRSSLGHGSLAFPAARHGLHRSCLQGADLRGPNRGVGPGLSSRGCDPSWPSSRTDDVLDTWSGGRVPGRWATSVGPPEGMVTGSAPSWASSTPTHRITDPRIVTPAPCRGPAGESCRTPLMSFSKIPSIDIRSARPLPEKRSRGSPRTGSSGPRPAGERSSGLDPKLSPRFRALLSFGPSLPWLESRSAPAVPPGFGGLLRARGAGLLHPAADHGVRLVSGSPWPCALGFVVPKHDSSQKASAVSIPGDRQAKPRAPLGESERTNPPHLDVRAVAAASRRSALMPGVVREVDCRDPVLADVHLRVIPPTFAPATFPSPREVGSVPPALVFHCLSRHSLRRDTLRSVSLAHSQVRFQGSGPVPPRRYGPWCSSSFSG
jgi:hypothetical protein